MNKFFISFNFILCIVLSVVAILPKVQEYQPRSGLLQSSVVSLYTIYLTWSAMSNQPGNLLNNVKSIYLPNFRFSWTDDHCKPHLSQILTPTNEPPKSNPAFDTESIIGLVIWFICVLYSSIRTASSGQTERLIGADKVLAKDETGSGKPLIVTSIFVNRSGTWKKNEKIGGFQRWCWSSWSRRRWCQSLGQWNGSSGVLLVVFPSDLLPGYALRHDDLDQLVQVSKFILQNVAIFLCNPSGHWKFTFLRLSYYLFNSEKRLFLFNCWISSFSYETYKMSVCVQKYWNLEFEKGRGSNFPGLFRIVARTY